MEKKAWESDLNHLTNIHPYIFTNFRIYNFVVDINAKLTPALPKYEFIQKMHRNFK